MTDIKKFGVVICPKCHHPRGVRLNAKQSGCFNCNYTFKIKDLKRFYETDSESALAESVGRLNAKLQGGLEIYLDFLEEYENVPAEVEQLEPHKRIASKLRDINELDKRLEKLAFELSIELGEFSDEDIFDVLGELGISESQAKKMLKTLLDNNLIYEPRQGIFMRVDPD
jgi:hypothetical protein